MRTAGFIFIYEVGEIKQYIEETNDNGRPILFRNGKYYMKLVYYDGFIIYRRDNNLIFNNPDDLYMSDRFTTNYCYFADEDQWYSSSSLRVSDKERKIKKTKVKDKLEWTMNRVEEVWPEEIEIIENKLISEWRK